MAKKQIEQTEIEAPYELPEGWKWSKLGHLCDLLNGFAFKSSDYVDESNVINFRMSQIRPGGFTDLYHNTKYLPDSYADKYKDFLLNDGDVVIAMTDMANDAKILGVPTIVYTDGYKLLLNQRVGKLFNISKSIDSKFLNYMLVSPYIFNYYKSLGKGGLQLNISKPDILNANIPLPPTLEEQQRIVNRIETLFAKLDEAKEKAQNVVDTFETRKASILYKAFTGELTKKWREENSVGDDSWEEKKLEEISLKIGDGLHGTPIYAENGKFAFINGNNFSNDHIEIKNDTKYVNKDEYEKHFIELFADKTVFVSINGTLGKTAFYNDEKVILGKSACYINVKNEFLSKHFLKRYFETKEFLDYANEKATGSTIKNLGLKAMRDLKINLPSLPEQTEIVRILDVILEKETKAKESAEAVLEQIDLLKKSILARAFRGEL